MTRSSLPRTKLPGFRSDLPSRIAGIVFWGLVVVGLVLSIVLLQGQERSLRAEQAYVQSLFMDEVDRLMQTGMDFTDPHFRVGMETLLDTSVIQAVEILHDGAVNYFGTVRAGGKLEWHTLHMDDSAVDLRVAMPAIKALLEEKRKSLLLTLGGLFLMFGFILQWVLQKVLSQPFQRMVDIARDVSGGDMNARFDDLRKDEFGFLGTFINQALDHALRQQHELQNVLQRVRESEQALHLEKERAEVTLHSIADGVITTNAQGCVEYFNPVAEQLTGLDLDAVRGRQLHDILMLQDENTREALENPVDQCLKLGIGVGRSEHTMLLRKDGEEVFIAHTAAPMLDSAGELLGAVLVFHDVGHARKLARQLSYQASHDVLTGLYNRREFEQQLHAALEIAQEEDRQHAVCYLDLDQFKVVNDTCGHIAGDEMLRQLASLLQPHVRETDVLARLGGDEFGVLLRYCSLDQARRIADTLRRTVSDFRFVCDEHIFEVGVSIGLVSVTRDSQSMAEILSTADVACYAAKDSGRNRVHVYQPDDSELKQRRGEMRWVSRIRKALEEDRLTLYYQPIRPVTGKGRAHYELLLRMQDEDGELVPPMAFIPAAERYDLMPLIDRWVVSTVLKGSTVPAGMPADSICTINLSGQSLGEHQFLDFVLEQLARGKVPAEQVCFEITETAAIANLHHATHFINSVRAKGCRFALDDFGSGLSSFAYLKNLPVDYLKIDGSFVRDMVEDPIDQAMVDAINRIGHEMGIETIAEFVENEETLVILQTLGVDYAQGYWLGYPAPLQAPEPRVLSSASV